MARYGTGSYFGASEYYGGEAFVLVASANPIRQPHGTVIIGGVMQTRTVEWSSAESLNTPTTAMLTMDAPVPAEVVVGATVELLAGTDDDAEQRAWIGQITKITPRFGLDGMFAQIDCGGYERLLDLPLNADLVWAGGAKTSPVLFLAGPVHIGDSSAPTWYAVPVPIGNTYSVTIDPEVDVRFIRISGRQHGANSYQAEPDSDIKDFSRIEIWQDGKKRGYVNLPTSQERWSDKLDYTLDANWEAFDVSIGCTISANGGAVTVKFVAGSKPKANPLNRDEFEVKGCSYQTAGQMPVHQVMSSLLKNRQFGPHGNGIPYRVKVVRDIHGNSVLLGGNGLVENGQVRIAAQDHPWTWLTETAQLFGYAVMGNPDGILIAPVRGDPANKTEVLTIQDGVNLLDFQPTDDLSTIITDWTVYGASGADENGQSFRYQSQSSDTAPPSWLLTADDTLADSKSSDLLVSDGLCRTVRNIVEIETSAAPTLATVDIAPNLDVRLGDVVRVICAPFGFDRKMWVVARRHVFSVSGFWTTLDLRVSNGGWTPEDDPGTPPEVAPSTATKHIGATSLAWYVNPTADGNPVVLTFRTGGAYSAIRVDGRLHGSNSYPSGSKPSTWSTVEVWQFGTKVGEAHLPIHHEQYTAQHAYTNDRYWGNFDVTIAADLANADAELHFTRGVAVDSSNDEYEIKNTAAELYTEANEQSAEPLGGIDWQAHQSRRRWRWAS